MLTFLLGEAFLGFLAIIAVALTLLPMLFEVSPAAARVIEGAQWAIIALFAAEYVLALTWSDDRRAFLCNPWRLLDLLTIVVPLATIVPSVSNLLRSSVVLRLIRLVRIVTFSVRASGLIARNEARRAAQTTAQPTQITRVRRQQTATVLSRDDFRQQLQAGSEAWFHIQHPTDADLAEVATNAGTTAEALRAQLAGAGFPHIERFGDYAGCFVWVPEIRPAGEIARAGLLLLLGQTRLLSLSQRPADLLAALPAEAAGTQPFAARMAAQFFRAALLQNEQLTGLFTHEIRDLEDVPVRESRTGFFEKTFRLKKELSAAQADLWRLKSLLSELAEGRATLPGVPAGESPEFRRLADDAAYLHETIVNLREEVLSLIDLHINVVSFDMNRIMRVLAVISALGLIPSVVGGLLGMNLADNPWPMTLPQVAFGVCFGMIVGLYLFFVKGWLR